MKIKTRVINKIMEDIKGIEEAKKRLTQITTGDLIEELNSRGLFVIKNPHDEHD